MKPIVILDNGHGADTPGKRSPIWADGTQLHEWQFNREIVKRIAIELDALNIPYEILTPEDNDISLGERCRRANRIYQANHRNAYLLSIHANAGGGTGWECFTSVGETKSDDIATILCREAESTFIGQRMRFDHVDGDPDKEAQFYILRKTACPAILTENFFMDTEKDCRYIMSEEGKIAIVQMHVESIKEIISL